MELIKAIGELKRTLENHNTTASVVRVTREQYNRIIAEAEASGILVKNSEGRPPSIYDVRIEVVDE